ncbi:hypothetical protein [Streptomyces sp. NPDC001100]
MHRRKIPHTPIEVTELGFGASVIGNLYRVTDAHVASAAADQAMPTLAGLRDQGLLRAETPFAPDERSQPCP